MTDADKLIENKLDQLWAKYYSTDLRSVAALETLTAIAIIESLFSGETQYINRVEGLFSIGPQGPVTIRKVELGVMTPVVNPYFRTLKQLRAEQEKLATQWLQSLSMYSMTDAAYLAQTTVGNISMLAAQHKVDFRGGAAWRKERDELIVRMYAEKPNRAAIARVFDLSSSAIHQILDKAGVYDAKD